MNLEKTIDINNVKNELDIEKGQNQFLDSMLGKAINTGIDIGLRAILPDVIEEQVISIKDNLMNYGLKDGIKKTIRDTLEIGKSALGIVTGKFENIGQMQTAVKKGGIIDSVSKIIDMSINQAQKYNKVDSNIASMLREGKNTILNSVESNIEKNFTTQEIGVEKLDKYISNWKKYYDKKDFNGMEKEYKKINKELNNLVPLENTLKEARNVENIHTLIKTNGQKFDLSETENELLEKFS